MKNSLFLNTIPKWYQDLIENPRDYFLVLSDDFDSLLSCNLIKRCIFKKSQKNIDIGGYFAFDDGLYLTKEAKERNQKPVYVDLAVTNGYSFDNHRMPTKLTSEDAINPNCIIDSDDPNTYFRKYCGSTYLMLLSLFDEDVFFYSLKDKATAVSLDSFYKGAFSDSFKHINDYWLDELGLKNGLKEVFKYFSENDFKDFIVKEKLFEKITIKNGKLQTYRPHELLPDEKFTKEFSVKRINLTRNEIDTLCEDPQNKVFNCAEVYKNYYVANVLM